jgi:hypothetical protein
MKIIAFGDSFVNVFQSLKCDKFKIIKFKGALIQGLINENENYISMIKILNSDKYDYSFFIFGNVDLNFYFYKKKYVDGIDEKIIMDTIFNNAEKYVKLISLLPNIKNKYILNVFPSTISDFNFKDVLKIYSIVPENKLINLKNNNIKYKNRNTSIIKFNDLLEKYCNIYNVNYCNIYNQITNKKKCLNKIFKLQQNPYNIHFNNEYILIIFLNFCLSFLCNKKILFSYEDIIIKIQNCSNNYINRISERDGKKYKKFDINKIEKYIKELK